ncbi:EAL and HDOD domain-containing protein [Rheinheimera oceanensis]|uniref:EAL and HDOD domain-containing protein n=1 Tax=Rheinheimera oceanensis TaxID=2817449 RepID=UPI001BFE3A9E
MSQQPQTIINGKDLQSLFAAQPIFDRNKQRYAVELLYRSDTGVTALELGDVKATTELLYNLCSGITEQIEQYRAPVFINVCSRFLLSRSFLPLEPSQVVIELIERIEPTPEFIAAVASFKQQGFRFALDDFEFSEPWLPLLELADIIKIDVLNSSLAEIERYKAQYSRPGLIWLAEKVETEQQFAAFKALGCELFQGYFLAKPLLIAGKKIEPSVLRLAEIIGCLFADEPDINQLVLLLQDEPAIVMGMLKIVNSPLYRKTREVSSVKEMVTRLGLELTRKWVLMYAVLNNTAPTAAITVLTRAYTAQRIAKLWQLSNDQCHQYFLAALISGSDMLFGVESDRFLQHLNINPDIQQAISCNSGRMAEALAIVCNIERGYALKLAASAAELPYISCYNQELADVQKRLALVL